MYQNYKVAAELNFAELGFLRQKWAQICLFYQLSPEKIIELAKNCLGAYSQKGRFYHNLSHIFNLIQLSEGLNLPQNELFLFQIAIFYHDIIYNPTSKTNEAESAELAKNHWQNVLSAADMEQLQTYILSSTQHQNLNQKAETQLFLAFVYVFIL